MPSGGLDAPKKVCNICHEEKLITKFESPRNGSTYSACKVCRGKKRQERMKDPEKKAHYAKMQKLNYEKNKSPENERINTLKYKYKITLEDYSILLDKQDGRCAICGILEEKNLSIDHDHTCCPGRNTCGKCIRGLLCGRCNLGLGYFGDSIEKLTFAISYLRNYSEVK